MITKTQKTNNLTIVRNVAYSQIKKMKKNIKEIVEVDSNIETNNVLTQNLQEPSSTTASLEKLL